MYTALDTLCRAERLNLAPIAAPAAPPPSNGMAEAFVNTLRRDCVPGAHMPQDPGLTARPGAATMTDSYGWRKQPVVRIYF